MSKNILVAFIIILIICIYWFIYMLATPPKLLRTEFEKIKFKTGDMILFHAYDNINPVFIGSYWGHVGIVYVDPDNKTHPMIFEAASTTKMKNCPEYNKRGIMITDLKKRLEKYPGLIACKFLNTQLNEEIILGFRELIRYAIDNMYYYDSVISNGFKKKNGDPLNNATNCGELLVLSLIKLGLISENVLDNAIAHHLLYVINLKQLNGNYYLYPTEITFNPF